MATQVIFAYEVKPVSVMTLAALEAKLAAVTLPTGPGGDVQQIYQASLISDTTTTIGPLAVRTITLGLGSLFNIEFPAGSDQAAPFRELYAPILSNALQSNIVSTEPLVT